MLHLMAYHSHAEYQNHRPTGSPGSGGLKYQNALYQKHDYRGKAEVVVS